MKKHTIAIISVILCFAPIYTHARNLGSCPKESCNSTAGCELVGSSCERCKAGTYNEGGAFSKGCEPCLKPEGAEWISRGDSDIGMVYAKECRWEIYCPADHQIDPAEWAKMDVATSDEPLKCEACPEGEYKDANTAQIWYDDDWSSTSGLCQPKTFKIYANIVLPEACRDLTDTANTFLIVAPIITYTADQTFEYPFDDVKKVIENDQYLNEDKPNFTTSYTYPFQTTVFELQPLGGTDEGAQSINVKLDLDNNLVFQDKKNDHKNTIKYKNDKEFYINIYMEEKEPTYIAYCPSEVKTEDEANANCVFEQFDKCVPTKKTLSDISFTTTPDCSNGKYVNSWKLLDGAHNYDWTKSTEIKFTDPITLPSSSSKIFYMAPKFQDCPVGTINSNKQCDTQCQTCPTGFSSIIPATQCYLNISLKDNLGTYKPIETIILQ